MLDRDAERAHEDDAWLAEALDRYVRAPDPRLRAEII